MKLATGATHRERHLDCIWCCKCALKTGKESEGGTMTIRAVPYKEARLAHFKATMERRRKTLHWWECQKPGKQYDAQTIHGMCSDLGREIGYLDDVILMLEKMWAEVWGGER